MSEPGDEGDMPYFLGGTPVALGPEFIALG